MVIRTSPRAFVIAMLPLALLQAALLASGIAGEMGGGKAGPTPDQALAIFSARFGISAAMLVAGHLALRYHDIAARAAYGLMGGAAVAIAYVVGHLHAIYLTAPVPGTVVTSALVPVCVGMVCGFLYAQLAGRDFAEVTLMPTMQADTIASSRSAPAPSFPPATYDGPVVVRTSIAATAVAAAVPAIVVTAIMLSVLMLGVSTMPSSNTTAQLLTLPAMVLFVHLFVMFVPAIIVVGATHALARSLGFTSGRHYALVGAGLNCVAALLLIALVHAAVLFPAAVILGALMGAVYRRFAGIEPLPLPEEVLARDPRTLVPSDHPSRRTHAVIMNG